MRTKMRVIKVEEEDLDRFEESFKQARDDDKEWGGLRASDGWSQRFKYLVNLKIDGDRKTKKILEDRNLRVGESESLRIINENLRERVQKLEETQRMHDEEVKKIMGERDEWKRRYLGI